MTALSGSLRLSGMSALVVEPEEADRTFLVALLTSAGLLVTAVDNFTSARATLLRQPPTVLVTEIRLGFHNGLHLAHLARWRRPELLLVMTSRYCDPVLTRDAAALGASFVEKPLSEEGVLAALYRTHTEGSRERQAHDPMVAGPPPLPRWWRTHER